MDTRIVPVLDALRTKLPGLITAASVDLNGFVLANDRVNHQDWTDDFERDNRFNRIKRFFDDEYALFVARCGLSAAFAHTPLAGRPRLDPRTMWDHAIPGERRSVRRADLPARHRASAL